MDVRRRCTYYEKPIHQFTPSPQIKHRAEAHVCVYISHKSLLWSTFVESNEITQQRIPILYLNFTLQYSVADRRWAWAWGLRASPLSSVSASPASNLSWESPENSMASLVLVTLLDSGHAGVEVLYGSTHRPQLLCSQNTQPSLSVISLLNPPNVCTDWGTHCSAKALLAAAEFSMNRWPQSRARLFTS